VLVAFGLSPSPMEIMVIAMIALIVLGPSRLPEAARSLGKGLREMRDSFQGNDDDDDDDDDDDGDDDGDDPRLDADLDYDDDEDLDADLDELNERDEDEEPQPAATRS